MMIFFNYLKVELNLVMATVPADSWICLKNIHGLFYIHTYYGNFWIFSQF